MFTQLGCDLTGKQIVVVESSQHFYASYAQLARRVIYVAAPGSMTQGLKSLLFRKIKRPKWPL
jgi:microcystin degradation protein MlrC